jgi:hypothetical protein
VQTSALLRRPGTFGTKLQSRCANWTGCVSLKCGSSAARSTSTSWSVSGERKLAEMLATQGKYDEFRALPLIVLPD